MPINRNLTLIDNFNNMKYSKLSLHKYSLKRTSKPINYKQSGSIVTKTFAYQANPSFCLPGTKENSISFHLVSGSALNSGYGKQAQATAYSGVSSQKYFNTFRASLHS